MSLPWQRVCYSPGKVVRRLCDHHSAGGVKWNVKGIAHLDGEGDLGDAAGGGPQQVRAHGRVFQQLGGLRRVDVLEVGVPDGATHDLPRALRLGFRHRPLRLLRL